mgnify:CR=1 FL=1
MRLILLITLLSFAIPAVAMPEKADFSVLPMSPRPPDYSTRGDLISLTNTSSAWIFSIQSGVKIVSAGYTLIEPNPMTIEPGPVFSVRVEGRDIPSNLWLVAPVVDDSGSALVRMRYSEGNLNLSARLWLVPLEDGRIKGRLRVANLSLLEKDFVVTFPYLPSISFDTARTLISSGTQVSDQKPIEKAPETRIKVGKPTAVVVTAEPWSSAFYLYTHANGTEPEIQLRLTESSASLAVEFSDNMKTLQSLDTGEVTLGLTKGDNMSVWSELRDIGLLK